MRDDMPLMYGHEEVIPFSCARLWDDGISTCSTTAKSREIWVLEAMEGMIFSRHFG